MPSNTLSSTEPMPPATEAGRPDGHAGGPKAPFRPAGLWVALLTPFRDQQVDHAALARLVKRLDHDGVDGLVVCGSTGEAASLGVQERHAVLRTVAQAAPDLPLIVGLSAESLHEARHWAHAVRQEHPQVRALLVPAPSYVRPSQAGLLAWFDAVATAAERPIVVYDIPYRTGTPIELETLLRLAQDPRFVGIKDCGGNANKTQQLIHDGHLAVMAGEDLQAFASLALGAAGAILACAHVATPHWVRLVQHLRRGELAAARVLWPRLRPLAEALMAEPNPAVIKAVLAAHEGFLLPDTRLPLTISSQTARERASDLFKMLC